MKWRYFFWIIIPIGLFPLLLNNFAFWQIQQSFKLDLKLKPALNLSFGSVDIKNFPIKLREKLVVHSGELKVRYVPTGVIFGDIPILIEGRQVEVSLESNLADVLGAEAFLFDELLLRAVLSRDKGFVLETFKAKSKSMSFDLTGSG